MWMILSVVCLIAGALCWTVGDALLVGFAKPDTDKFGQFIDLMGDDAYAFQLGACPTRLRWGALIANYSTFLLALGLYSHMLVAQDSIIGIIAIVLLGIGVMLSPLAHGAFYYFALASQHAYANYRAGVDAAGSIQLAQDFTKFLKYAWIPAVAITAGGWVLFSLSVALGLTILPWWAVFFTPVITFLPLQGLKRLPYPGKPLLDGAVFNMVTLVWATALLVLILA